MQLQQIRMVFVIVALLIIGGGIWYALRPSADVVDVSSIDFLSGEQLGTGTFENTEYKDGKIQLKAK